MMSSGIDLWNSSVRSRIEQFQFDLTLDLLREGDNVIVEWGVWTRGERDALRDAAHSVGALAELHHVTASVDELWRRIVERDLEGRWGSRSIRREELEAWAEAYEEPTAKELSTYDLPWVGVISPDSQRPVRCGT
jgi:predicted kinase